MNLSRSCSWCHEMTPVTPGVATLCRCCEHRADVARLDCDCARCRRFEAPQDAHRRPLTVGDRVEFVEPHDGFAGGTLVEVLRGILGPVAVVEVAPGRKVDTLCRRVRKCE